MNIPYGLHAFIFFTLVLSVNLKSFVSLSIYVGTVVSPNHYITVKINDFL